MGTEAVISLRVKDIVSECVGVGSGPVGGGGRRGARRPWCENHARKMRTFFTRRLEPKTKSSNAFKWSLRPKRK